jgi:tetratricopeptide (TPR) repeat protein
VVIGKRLLLGHYRQKADVALFLSGDYKTAIEYYDKLISWRPDAAGYYYNRGDAYDKDGQYEKAISDYNKSLQLGIEDSLQTILRIAFTAKRQGDFETEEQYLQQLLKLSKDKQGKENEFWAANYHLGKVEFKKKNYRKAIDYYNIAHIATPTNLELYHRANSYFALGLLDSARQDLKQSLSFVKADFVRKNPNSILATCDTCSFPFGSREYELLTEPNGETIIQTLDKFADDKSIKELNDKLKSTEKNSR